MKSKEVETMAMQLLPKLPGFRVKGRLMFAYPVQHVLRAVYFERTSDAEAFAVPVFFLPLYIPRENIHFSFAKHLRPVIGTNRWYTDEPCILDKLLQQIETVAVPFLNSVATLEQVLLTLDVRAATSVNPHDWEALAYTHVLLGQMSAAEGALEHLQSHYTAKLNAGLSASSIRYHHAVIHIALQTAVKWGLLGRNVADAVEPPRIHRAEMQTWDEGEVNQFLEAAKDSPYYALFHTAIYTGMRRSELLGLRWSDIDFLSPQISVSRSLHHLKNGSYVFTEPKSAKSRRTIALSPAAVLTLTNHHETQKLERLMLWVELKENDLVFSRVDGKPLRPNSITRAWDTMCNRAGVKKIRLHDARHTHASLMLKQGIHPKIVQERLGHSSIQITLDTYSHVAPGLQEAAALRFDEIINPTREKEAVK